MLEVVVEHMGLVGEDGEGDVVTHAVGGFDPRLRHGLEDHLRVLCSHPNGSLHPQEVGRVHGGLNLEGGVPKVLEGPEGLLGPLLVWMLGGNGLADCGIVEECASLEISHHHLTGSKSTLGHHVLSIADDVAKHADLRSNVDHVVLGPPEPGRPKAVPVEPGSHLVAVRKDEEGRPIPTLLEALVVLVKVNSLRVGLDQVRVVAVGLCVQKESSFALQVRQRDVGRKRIVTWDEEHEGLRDLKASPDEELSNPVQVGRVGGGGITKGG